MDPALKRTCAFIQRKFLSWPALCMEISLHHVHHWPNQKQRIMICFSLQWVGLIWITDVKIPQDVLKMISGHVVAKKWHVKNAVSTPILFQRIFLENPHNHLDELQIPSSHLELYLPNYSVVHKDSGQHPHSAIP